MSKMSEALEPRRLLSAVVTQHGSDLVITNAQSIQVTESGGNVSVVDNTTPTQPGPFTGVQTIEIYAGNIGASITYTGGDIGAKIVGGNGNDNILVFDHGPGSTVSGGNGNDTLTAGLGNDTILDGDPGNDTIVVVAGSAIVNGGPGNDTIVLGPTATATVQPSVGTDTIIQA